MVSRSIAHIYDPRSRAVYCGIDRKTMVHIEYSTVGVAGVRVGIRKRRTKTSFLPVSAWIFIFILDFYQPQTSDDRGRGPYIAELTVKPWFI